MHSPPLPSGVENLFLGVTKTLDIEVWVNNMGDIYLQTICEFLAIATLTLTSVCKQHFVPPKSK